MLDWTQQELAANAKISNQTVRNFEHRSSELRDSTAQLLRMLFEANGVVFIDENGGGPGVRLEKPLRGDG